MIGSDVDAVRWFKSVIAAYEKKFPGRKVNLMQNTASGSAYYTKLILMLKTNTDIDAVYEDSFMLNGDVQAGLLVPIPEVKNWYEWNKFYPRLRKSVTIDKKVYGIPVTTDTRGLFYNTKIFKKAGIKTPWQPKNWQDIIDTFKIIKEKVPGVFPITLTASQAMGEGTTMQTLEMLLFGTKSPLYKNKKWILSSPGMLNSLKFLNTLAKDGLLPRLDIIMNPQYGNIMQSDLAPNSKVAIILDGAWNASRWAKDFPETYKTYKLAMMPTEFGQKPGFITMSGSWLLSSVCC